MKSSKTSKYICIRALAIALALACAVLSGCVDARAVLRPEYTVPPEATQTPEPTPEPTPTVTPTPNVTATPAPMADALGNPISGVDHFQRYISFRNVQVYEQENDTFIDAIALNDYPETLVCALTASFYDESGELIAECRLQTRDAQYILILPPGETALIARVDTDMSLTDMTIEFSFDETLGVKVN